jgi:hypothetical protein
MAAGACHRKDTGVSLEKAAPHERLNPVDQTVRHDIEGHDHLGLGEALPRLGDVGLERAESQAVQKGTQFRTVAHLFGQLVQNLPAVLIVGRVYVEIPDPNARLLQLLHQGMDLLHGGSAVQVDAANVHAPCGQGSRRSGPEPARSPENQGPSPFQRLCRQIALLPSGCIAQTT